MLSLPHKARRSTSPISQRHTPTGPSQTTAQQVQSKHNQQSSPLGTTHETRRNMSEVQLELPESKSGLVPPEIPLHAEFLSQAQQVTPPESNGLHNRE